jgi:hypothetical protein
VGSVGLAVTPLTVAPARAAGADPVTLTVIASGLHNPRGITVLHDGTVLVAEAGEGLPGCAAGQQCVGLTGSVYKVKGSYQGRVVTGLASAAKGPAAPGAPVVATGPDQAVPDYFHGGYDVLSGLGGDVAARTALGADAATLGTLFRTRDGKVLADPVAFENANNPDGLEVFSNPNRFASNGWGGFLIADAGANDLVKARANGAVTLDTVAARATTAAGTTVDGVPTSVVRSWDGTVYYSDLGGSVPGLSRVWKLEPGGTPQVLASGLNNLVDLALDHSGNLVALSYSSSFATGGPGALLRIDARTGAVTTIPTGTQLVRPTGLAVGPNNSVYVDNNGTGLAGQLVRVDY